MTLHNQRDYIYLIWQDPKTRTQYTVGELSRHGDYQFRYIKEINEAIKMGFKPIVSLDDITKTYHSPELFGVFQSRLPDSKRKDMDLILDKYSMEKFDPYELLKKSGGKLPIDQIYFIEPLLKKDDLKGLKFEIAGTKYYLKNDFVLSNYQKFSDLTKTLQLIPEPSNAYDSNAVRIFLDSTLLGYVPRFYSEELSEFLDGESNFNISKLYSHTADKSLHIEVCYSSD